MLIACGVAAVALGLGGWAVVGRTPDHVAAGRVPQVRVPASRTEARSRSGSALGVARPLRLVIPEIGVSTRLVRLGLTSTGALEVPVSAAVAGWFTSSPRPGAIGSAIIIGHIDSRVGPGVFFQLKQLRRGEHVYVVRADASVATFTITAVRSVAKTAFPSAAVYGPVPDAELRLITCGGQFDHATGSYLNNTVVYATLIKSTSVR